MAKEKNEVEKEWKKNKWHHGNGVLGWFYFLSMIAAAIYFIQQIHGFWLIVLALLKAVVWPVFVMYHVFSLLKI